ncbi:MAG: hypothetical protein R2794_11350 [Chitinophagales bacterium]
MKKTAYFPFILLFLVSCKSWVSIPDDFDYGRMEKGRYINDYFSFNCGVPDGWQVILHDGLDSITKESLDAMRDDNPDAVKTIEASSVRSAQLVAMTQTEGDTGEYLMSSFVITVENVRLNTDIKNGKDYLQAATETLTSSGLHMEVAGDITAVTLGGKEFYKLPINNAEGLFTLHQLFYATIINRFAFVVVSTYDTDSQLEKLEKALGDFVFEK